MAPAALTPGNSGTSTPTSTSASALTQAGIKHALNGGSDPLRPLDVSKITVTLNPNPQAVPEPDSAETRAQKTCTDHMVQARWTVENGWDAPELKPYGPLNIWPSASVLHYATECFEGLKLYRGFDGKLRLFRVERNCQRMLKSARRIALPDFDPKELEKMIIALCAQDGDKWLPKERAGHFLYVRPTFIGTDQALGVQKPREALLYVIICCFPDMTKSMPPALNGAAQHANSGLKLLASNEDTIRAWPGGFGYAKLGANYGPSLVAQGEARSRGFDQVLWLFGKECYVTEAGASNFFIVWRNKESGKLQLVTAPLEERIILEGVTRASILELAKSRLAKAYNEIIEEVEVVEQRFTMDDILSAQREGRLVEAFAAGTAFFVAPISLINFRGKDLEIPMAEGETGAYAKLIKSWLVSIMYGKEQHEWGIIVKE